ncbi:hypothetical protein IWX50DRAFT_637056 [Phyllosticta citricarpa]
MLRYALIIFLNVAFMPISSTIAGILDPPSSFPSPSQSKRTPPFPQIQVVGAERALEDFCTLEPRLRLDLR